MLVYDANEYTLYLIRGDQHLPQQNKVGTTIYLTSSLVAGSFTFDYFMLFSYDAVVALR